MRTYGTSSRNPFRMRTYKKHPGWGPSFPLRSSPLTTRHSPLHSSSFFSRSCALFCTFLHSRKTQLFCFQALPHSASKNQAEYRPPSFFQESESVPTRPPGKERESGQKIAFKGQTRLDHCTGSRALPFADGRTPCSRFNASSTGPAMVSRTRSRNAGTSSFASPLVSWVSCTRPAILPGHSIQRPSRLFLKDP